MKTLYEATTQAIGGREGKVHSENSPVDFNLSVPKSMGGKAPVSASGFPSLRNLCHQAKGPRPKIPTSRSQT